MSQTTDELKKPVHIQLVMNYESYQSNKDGKVGILNHLDILLQSETGSDVEFIVQGEKIKGHTLILKGGSPVLAAMFESDMTESFTRTVVVEDIEPSAFRAFLRYLYTGNTPFKFENDNMIEQLFIAADKYQVVSLKEWCDSLLCKKINDENAMRLLVLAHLHSDEWLKEDCIKFIVKNKLFFFERVDFRALNRNYPDLFFEISQQMHK
jgi:speckle-type POZ protein